MNVVRGFVDKNFDKYCEMQLLLTKQIVIFQKQTLKKLVCLIRPMLRMELCQSQLQPIRLLLYFCLALSG